MNAPAYEVLHGNMVLVAETQGTESLTRLEYLRRRAEALGHSARLVEHNGAQVLAVNVSDGARVVGSLVCWPETATDEEHWTLTADCRVMAGLVMQVDYLPANAVKIREVFAALVCP